MKATYEPLDFANSITAKFNKSAEEIKKAADTIGIDPNAIIWICTHMAYMQGLIDSAKMAAISTERCIQRDGLYELAALDLQTRRNELGKVLGKAFEAFAPEEEA